MNEQYLKINKALWDAKTPIHYHSDFYDMASFLENRNSLNSTELDLLGDLSGKSVLHLQCHFGQDTLSMANMGAVATGLDLSEQSIIQARALASELELAVNFVECDLYSAKDHIDDKFDIVFTSYGTIGWLPDLDKWADVVSHFLKPQGKFIMVDFHPFIWMHDGDLKNIAYSYFNRDAIVEENQGSYTDRNADIKLKEIGWNHDLSEVLTSLLDKNLALRHFGEHNFSHYNCFPHMKEVEKGRYIVEHWGDKAPLMFSLVFEKG